MDVPTTILSPSIVGMISYTRGWPSCATVRILEILSGEMTTGTGAGVDATSVAVAKGAGVIVVVAVGALVAATVEVVEGAMVGKTTSVIVGNDIDSPGAQAEIKIAKSDRIFEMRASFCFIG